MISNIEWNSIPMKGSALVCSVYCFHHFLGYGRTVLPFTFDLQLAVYKKSFCGSGVTYP